MTINEIQYGIVAVTVISLAGMTTSAYLYESFDPEMFYVAIAAIAGMAGYDLYKKEKIK